MNLKFNIELESGAFSQEAARKCAAAGRWSDRLDS